MTPAERTAATDRATAALLGVHAGDSLGATLEFLTAEACNARYPDGLRDIVGGGPFDWEPGAPTDDTDLTWAVAQGYRDAGFGPQTTDHAARRMAAWLDGDPADVGGTTREALSRYRRTGDPSSSGATDERSQANGSLMRIMPVAVVRAFDPDQRDRDARSLSAVTHGHPVCIDACVSYCRIAGDLIAGRSPGEAVAGGQSVATHPEVRAALAEAALDRTGFADLTGPTGGYVLWALRVAVRAVVSATRFEDGVVEVVMSGGDTDTNGAIAGGLLGARFGLAALPARWVQQLALAEPLRDFATDASRRWID